MKRTRWGHILIWTMCGLCLQGTASWAGEARVAKVRGSTLTLNSGARDGLVVGMKATVVRPPQDPIIHPVTGENLGSPMAEIASGEITKVTTRAALLRLSGGILTKIRSGDLVHFTTPEETMVQEQEALLANREKATGERQKLRGDMGKLTRDVNGIQATIRALEKTMRRIERIDESVKIQLRSINTDINTLKAEMASLKEAVQLLESVPVEGMPDEGGVPLSEDHIIQLKQIVQDEIRVLQSRLSQAAPAGAAVPAQTVANELDPPLPDEAPAQPKVKTAAEEPFYTQVWFFGILIALGLAGIGFFLYTRMSNQGDGTETEEEDEEEDMDFEIEDEEEDDIVVEETA